MRIHCNLHVLFEMPSIIADWATSRGHELTFSHLYKGDPLPSIDSFDFLLSMGGPQSVQDLETYPYLADEMALMRKVIKQDKYMLGVCLGAQLIATALGGGVTQSPEKEVGVFHVELTDAGRKDPILKDFPEMFKAVHWHSEMACLPDGVCSLMKSAGCPTQAFCCGEKIYGFQFHLEQKRSNIELMIANCAEDLTPGKYIQTPEAMLQEDYAAISQYAIQFLDALVARGLSH